MSSIARFLAIVVVVVAIPAWAQHEHDHDTAPLSMAPGHEMSSELRGLLAAEMNAIDSALRELLAALARGEWSTVEKRASEVELTFILRQELTAEQMDELHRVLPPAFLALDQEFHEDAAKLARAAGDKDPDLAVFYLSRLTAACISCHTEFAPDAFPGFGVSPEDPSHQH